MRPGRLEMIAQTPTRRQAGVNRPAAGLRHDKRPVGAEKRRRRPGSRTHLSWPSSTCRSTELRRVPARPRRAGGPGRVLGDDPGRDARARLAATFAPVDSGLRADRDVRRRRSPASAANRSRAGCTCRRPATGRCRRSSSTSATAAAAACRTSGSLWAARRLRALRHGHPRPGPRLGRSATRPTRIRAAAPAHPGFMTRGILDPRDYYYRRRVHRRRARGRGGPRAIPAVDPSRVAVHRRQPGRRASRIAVAGLVPDLAGVVPDVPFLCDFPRATTITDTRPVRRDRPLPQGAPRPRRAGLRARSSYFDGVNFAPRGHGARAVLGRPDGRDLPAVDRLRRVQHYGGPKEIEVYQFNDHEGGRGVPGGRQAALARRTASAADRCRRATRAA